MKRNKRNKRLLLKAAKRIEEIPQSYDQSVFCRADKSAPCGTVGCLAGEIIIASERSVAKGVEKLNAVVGNWQFGSGRVWPGDVAGELAGLNEDERWKLFVPLKAETWPRSFRSEFRRSKSGRVRAAAALLRYLADGGKVEA